MRVFLDFPIKRDGRVDVFEAGGLFQQSLSMFACISPKKDDSEVVAS